jgi:hypothetical protein
MSGNISFLLLPAECLSLAGCYYGNVFKRCFHTFQIFSDLYIENIVENI